MRSKATNILQLIIIITGVFYIITGIFFFISPLVFGRFFSINITDDWFESIKYEAFIAPLFFLSRGFASILFSVGLSMILPLFDPLRYRGLIYFTGIVFPVMSSYLLLTNGIILGHFVLTLFGLFYLFILVITVIGLMITRKDAKEGIE
ncbi:MAG: hypothetical protein SVR08_03945 [Spirochaetota bacterium]|nr:hypothetical protein [Spirochaetota bacterium]